MQGHDGGNGTLSKSSLLVGQSLLPKAEQLLLKADPWNEDGNSSVSSGYCVRSGGCSE